MARGVAAACLVGCVLLGDAARKRDVHMLTEGARGEVAFLYTIGSPGTASPPLQNLKSSNPCFPGLRVYNTNKKILPHRYDFVAGMTNFLKYYHPYMNVYDNDVDSPGRDGLVECRREGERTTNRPQWGTPKSELHGGQLYLDETRRELTPKLANYSVFVRTGHMVEPEKLTQMAPQHGWHMLAYTSGSNLLQNPETLECLLSFRGTDGTHEWVGNAMIGATKFCGLTNPEDECDKPPCETSKPGGSFTHWGFTNRLRMIVKDRAWQTEIRPKLGSCSSVDVGGHSAGAAMAELFTACVANAPEEGDYGYDTDYKYMGWNKGLAKKLDYLA